MTDGPKPLEYAALDRVDRLKLLPTFYGIVVLGIAASVLSFLSIAFAFVSTWPLCLLSGPACLLLPVGFGEELIGGTVAVYWAYWLAFAMMREPRRTAWPLVIVHLVGSVVGLLTLGSRLPY